MLGSQSLVAVGKFRVDLDADHLDAAAKKEAKQALGRFQDEAKKASQKMGDALKTGLAVGATATAAGIAVIGKQAIDAASDFDEAKNKLNQVFGDEGAAQVQKFAEKSAAAVGMSMNAANDAAATFGVFGKAAGKTGEDLAGFSTEMVTLAGDLASFHNTEPEQAIEALGAAMRGEAEPMRAYGVLLDDATMRQKALEMGLIETTKTALTPQNKTLAAQAVIMEQTADAQGDFARTSDGLANQQRILAAKFEDVKTKLGAGLLPIAQKFFTYLVDDAIPAAERIGNTFTTKVLPALGALKNLLIDGDFTNAFANIFDVDEDSTLVTTILGIREALISTGTWIGENRAMLAAMTAAVIAGVAAWKTYVLVTVGIPAALTAMKAAMIGLNLAMSANPVGLIIAGITALGAALVVAYTKVGWFRDAVNTAWSVIRDGWAVLQHELAWVWQTVGEPLLAGLLLAWEGFKVAFGLYLDAVGFYFKAMLTAIRLAWDNVGRPLLAGLMLAWEGFKVAFGVYLDAVGFYFKAMLTAIGLAWDNVGRPLLDGILAAGNLLGDGLSAIFSAINTDWRDTLDALRAGWERFGVPVVDAFLSGWERAQNGFERFRDAMGRVWDGIKTTFAKGANVAIDAINKLISGFKSIAGKLGIKVSLDTIPRMEVPSRKQYAQPIGPGLQALAGGGTVAGWSPHDRADNIHALLTAGEYVFPVHAVKRLGVQALEWLRQGKATVIPKFADGGFVDKIKGISAGARDFFGDALDGARTMKNWVANGVSSLLSKSGTMIGEIGNGLIATTWQGIKDKMSGWLASDDGGPLLPPTAGRVFGYRSQIAWIKSMLPWARITSSIRSGTLGGKSSNRSFHNRGRAVDVAGARPGDAAAMSRIFDVIKRAFGSSITELIYSPKGSGQIKRGRPHYYGGKTRAIHWGHVHWAMANGGLVRPIPKADAFDLGGVARGTGLLSKQTIKPERILSPRQTDAFERLVAQLESRAPAPAAPTYAARPIEIHIHESGDPQYTARAVMAELERKA